VFIKHFLPYNLSGNNFNCINQLKEIDDIQELRNIFAISFKILILKGLLFTGSEFLDQIHVFSLSVQNSFSLIIMLKDIHKICNVQKS